MKTIVATAYAVNPYKGSEDGMGWNFIYQIARFNKVIAITRENNRTAIEKYIRLNPDLIYENMTFLYFDLPKWARFWKRGGKGAMLYFYLWQCCIPNFVQKQNIHFDIAHNLNFHNDWTPSFLWKLKKPFVWGPIGHHPEIPSEYLKSYSKSYRVKNFFSSLIKKLFWNCSPSLKKTKLKASHIFCMNKSVPQRLKLPDNVFSITPSVATQDVEYSQHKTHSNYTILSAGRLVPLKGFDITIQSFAKFMEELSSEKKSQCELVIVGDGPELGNYKKMTKNLNLEKYVTFINWIERDDLLKLMKDSSVFLFPSHEGAGMVVAEALSFGLPVLCIDNCGPGEFIDSSCGIKASYSNYQQTIQELALGLFELFDSPKKLKQMSEGARKQFEKKFNWDVRGNEFRKVYLTI